MDNAADTPDTIRPTDLAAKLDCSVAYASQLLSGARVPSLKLAISIFDKAGIKLGPIANATADEIETARKLAA